MDIIDKLQNREMFDVMSVFRGAMDQASYLRDEMKRTIEHWATSMSSAYDNDPRRAFSMVRRALRSVGAPRQEQQDFARVFSQAETPGEVVHNLGSFFETHEPYMRRLMQNAWVAPTPSLSMNLGRYISLFALTAFFIANSAVKRTRESIIVATVIPASLIAIFELVPLIARLVLSRQRPNPLPENQDQQVEQLNRDIQLTRQVPARHNQIPSAQDVQDVLTKLRADVEEYGDRRPGTFVEIPLHE